MYPIKIPGLRLVKGSIIVHGAWLQEHHIAGATEVGLVIQPIAAHAVKRKSQQPIVCSRWTTDMITIGGAKMIRHPNAYRWRWGNGLTICFMKRRINNSMIVHKG